MPNMSEQLRQFYLTFFTPGLWDYYDGFFDCLVAPELERVMPYAWRPTLMVDNSFAPIILE